MISFVSVVKTMSQNVWTILNEGCSHYSALKVYICDNGIVTTSDAKVIIDIILYQSFNLTLCQLF